MKQTLPHYTCEWSGGVRVLGYGAVPPRGEYYDLVFAPESMDGDAWLSDAVAPHVIAVDGRIKFLRRGE